MGLVLNSAAKLKNDQSRAETEAPLRGFRSIILNVAAEISWFRRNASAHYTRGILRLKYAANST